MDFDLDFLLRAVWVGAWKLAGLATVLVLIVLWLGVALDRRLYGVGWRKADDRE